MGLASVPALDLRPGGKVRRLVEAGHERSGERAHVADRHQPAEAAVLEDLLGPVRAARGDDTRAAGQRLDQRGRPGFEARAEHIDVGVGEVALGVPLEADEIDRRRDAEPCGERLERAPQRPLAEDHQTQRAALPGAGKRLEGGSGSPSPR